MTESSTSQPAEARKQPEPVITHAWRLEALDTTDLADSAQTNSPFSVSKFPLRHLWRPE